jgi:hypothetical protein
MAFGLCTHAPCSIGLSGLLFIFLDIEHRTPCAFLRLVMLVLRNRYQHEPTNRYYFHSRSAVLHMLARQLFCRLSFEAFFRPFWCSPICRTVLSFGCRLACQSLPSYPFLGIRSPFLPRTRMACCIELHISVDVVSPLSIGQCRTLHALYLSSDTTHWLCAVMTFVGFGSSKISYQAHHIPVCIYWHVSPCRCQNHNPSAGFRFSCSFSILEVAKL